VTVKFKNFDEFYEFYLIEHSHPTSRKIHLVGSSFFILTIFLSFFFRLWWLPLVGIVLGYGSAWLSHFVFEKNSPSSFGNPFWSMQAGRKMFFEMATGKLDITQDWKKKKP
jgi:hypothetical protein